MDHKLRSNNATLSFQLSTKAMPVRRMQMSIIVTFLGAQFCSSQFISNFLFVQYPQTISMITDGPKLHIIL
jgi:hypothetical protein